jgi:enoyl-CoA hydratase/carnithine racemase
VEYVRLTAEEGGVRTLRLARPPVNALNAAMLDEIGAAVADLRSDSDVRALVVTGTPTLFAAGADVEEFEPIRADSARRVARHFRGALDALAAFSRPTVAAVAGYALGGGLELALACDFRVAGDNARLGLPEVQLGIIPGGGGTQRLTRLVGPAVAKELIFTGRHVRAPEALDLGLVDRVVGPDDVYAEALQWASQLAEGAVTAMGLAKRAIDGGFGMRLQDGLDLEADCFEEAFETDDAEHGIRSFLDEGPGKARFRGR